MIMQSECLTTKRVIFQTCIALMCMPHPSMHALALGGPLRQPLDFGRAVMTGWENPIWIIDFSPLISQLVVYLQRSQSAHHMQYFLLINAMIISSSNFYCTYNIKHLDTALVLGPWLFTWNLRGRDVQWIIKKDTSVPWMKYLCTFYCCNKKHFHFT